MKQPNPQLSALEMHYLAKELQILVGSKVDKIYQPEKNVLILQLHKTGAGKILLKFRVPGYFCMTETKQATEKPSEFCAYLRNKLSNSFLDSFGQKGFERIIELRFRLKEGSLSLMFELFSPGNIILVKEGKILSALEKQEYKDRSIKPGEEYKYPKREFNLLELTEEELKKLLQKSDKSSAVKALAMDLGLGGLFAEEACFNAEIDKDAEPKNIKKTEELFKALDSLRSNRIEPSKTEEEIFPFQLKSKRCEKTGADSFNQAVDELTKYEISGEQKAIEAKYNEKLKKTENMIKSQETSIAQLAKKEQELKEKGDRIYENFQNIEKLLSEAKDRNNLEKMKQSKKIKNYDLKEKTITVELNK
jgi:predicted ribosome quality control (RQC) complex YloA/Tae2 family protein